MVEDVDDRADIVHGQAVFRQVNVQSNAIEFSDHRTQDTR